MTDVSALLEAEFEQLRADLVARYHELDMRASGNWEASLAVEVSGNTATLVQAGYGDQLEHGRKPGKQPPSKAIEEWIQAKGIASRLEKGMSVSSLAYLIARKIGREGWDRQENGGTGLISSVVTPERIQQILDKAGTSLATEITNGIINHLKTAA